METVASPMGFAIAHLSQGRVASTRGGAFAPNVAPRTKKPKT